MVLGQKDRNYYIHYSRNMVQSGMRDHCIFLEQMVVVPGADVPWRRQTIVDLILQRPPTAWLVEVFHSPRAGELAAMVVGEAEVPEGYTPG